MYRALDIKYVGQAEFDDLYKMAIEIIVMIQKLIDYLEQSEFKGTKYKNRK